MLILLVHFSSFVSPDNDDISSLIIEFQFCSDGAIYNARNMFGRNNNKYFSHLPRAVFYSIGSYEFINFLFYNKKVSQMYIYL